MPFVELGRTQALLLPQDPEFIFPDNGFKFSTEKLDIFNNEICLWNDDRKYKFRTRTCNSSGFKLIPVGPEMWLLTGNNLYVSFIYILNDKVIEFPLSCFFHIVETGVYHFVITSNFNFFNFKTKKNSDLIFDKSDSVYFYKNYIFFSKLRIIYINSENPPNDVDLNIILQGPELRIFPEKDVKVNFRDTFKIFPIKDLLIFESVFINDQIENQDEIFLDIQYSEFNMQNLKTVIYLKSGSGYRSLLLDSFSEFSLENLSRAKNQKVSLIQ